MQVFLWPHGIRLCPGGGTRQIHKITSEWDSRKGALLFFSSFLVFQTQG